MVNNLYLRIVKDVANNKYSLKEIMSKFYTTNLDEFLDYLYKTFDQSLDEFVMVNQFRNDYHTFLFNLTQAVDDVEMLCNVSVFITKHIQRVKDAIKPYNKKELDKDERYYKLSRLKQDLEANLSDCNTKMCNTYEIDNVKVLKHIIFDIQDINVLFNIINRHKELVTIYYNEEPFLIYIIRFLITNISTLSDEDIEYYERVITMFIVSEEFSLSFKESDDIVQEIDYAIQSTQEGTNGYKALNYIRNILDKYSRNDIPSRYNCDLWVPKVSKLERFDMRNIPALTIDFKNRPKGVKVLYDDAFSIEECQDGTFFAYVHVPDVDQYIKDNAELEEHMQRVSQSRFFKNKMPMIPYPIAGKMSLLKDREIACLTFRLNVNQEGKVIKVDFFKSFINVCDNLSMTRADMLLKDRNSKLRPLLGKMYYVASLLRKNRDLVNRGRSKAGVIMDEYNIWANISTAEFFDNEGLVFPYRNYVEIDYRDKYIEEIIKMKAGLTSDLASDILDDVRKTRARQFYSTTNYGNDYFNGMPYGTVSNPLRDYMSLETGRLVKNVIDNTFDNDYWQEVIENDCIEHTELDAMIRQQQK